MRSRLRKVYALKVIYDEWLRLHQNLTGYLAMIMMRSRKRRLLVADSSLVVSLTTYGARLRDFHLTLESLVRQDITEPFAVHVHLSAEDLPNGDIPERLKYLAQHGVRFFVHSRNLRSYKKLVYEYMDSGANIVVTADDDVIYPGDWLRRLFQAHLKNPTAVVAFRAHFLKLSTEHAFIPYREMMGIKNSDGSRLIPRFDLMPTGVSGVLYPPASLDPLVRDDATFMKLAPSADDIWFKIASMKRGTRCVQVERKNRAFPFVPHSQSHGALHEENVARGRNDVQLKLCFDAYPELYSLVKEPLASGQDPELLHVGASND